MRISPEPSELQSGCASGFPVPINQSDAQEQNLRILANATPEESSKSCWIIASEERLPLLFFRQIFTSLQKQQDFYYKDDEELSPMEIFLRDEELIPIEVFQRAFERLFYVLGDQGTFDAQEVDVKNDGYAGWAEFACVFKRRNLSIKLSIPERIYITFDNPDTSMFASFVSFFVLMVICMSSFCFILGTAPEFQTEDPEGRKKPEPKKIFDVIENICLAIFVIEYCIRLCTSWSVRAELNDRTKLLELAAGHEPIRKSYPAKRLITFIIAPSNIIDLVAILPGVIGWISTAAGGDGLEGGGFVVLRLVRLTRIFRAFKNPKLVEPVIVIARTISNSTKALYVLAFNLLLGILIFGSLMYVFEKGEWEPETRTYNRKVGQKWNATSMVWEDVLAESPFLSIPHAFWWAVVTAMTVGYGDMYPTRSVGYIIGTATMVFSLVILALPVGVIGGNFSQAWTQYELEMREKKMERERDQTFITTAIQRNEPQEMRRMMLIEVWNERCPVEKSDKTFGPRKEVKARPDPAEFMGQALLLLDLTHEGKNQQTHTLDLAPPPGVKCEVSGTITIQYEWTPLNSSGDTTRTIGPSDEATAEDGDKQSASKPLHGTLKVTVVGADDLTNLSYHRTTKQLSNPYCMLFVYPNSPADGNVLCPSAWRSAAELNTLSPRWGSANTWNYCWSVDAIQSPRTQRPGVSADAALRQVSGETQGSTSQAYDEATEGEILQELRRCGQDVSQLRDEVRAVSVRVLQKIDPKQPFAPSRD